MRRDFSAARESLTAKMPQGAPGFIGVLLLGFSLRLLRLGHHGLFLDEAWSWATAQMTPLEIFRLSLRDPHPPLYYLLLKGFLVLLPDSEAGLRAFSLLASMLALATVWLAVFRWWGARAATYAGCLMAVSSFDLYYAQETRMYTLLAALWLLAYVLLALAMQGRHGLLLVWGGVNALMAWTHYYGLLVAATQAAFALIFWAWHRWRAGNDTLPGRWLGLGLLLTLIGSLPSLLVFWSFRSGNAGGAWVPQLQDLPGLFALGSVGLTAARSHFLDAPHLVWPPLESWSLGVWVLWGVIASGGMALWGLWRGWKCGGSRRWAALLALTLLVVPVTIVFVYARVWNRQVWAYKSFLGAIYLYYLWAGVGFAQVSRAAIRRGALILSLGLSLISLAPYFTVWHKTKAALAFHALPTSSQPAAVLLERAYRAPVAFYYLGGDAQVWGLKGGPETGFSLGQIAANGIQPENWQPLDCDGSLFRRVTDVWVYDPPARMGQEWQFWPACLAEKNLWVFQDGRWRVFEP